MLNAFCATGAMAFGMDLPRPITTNVVLPSFTPPPKRANGPHVDKALGPGDVPSDRPSICSGDTVLNSENRWAPPEDVSEFRGDELVPF